MFFICRSLILIVASSGQSSEKFFQKKDLTNQEKYGIVNTIKGGE
jgi:hypothetical protein